MSKEDEARARRFAENYNASQAAQRAEAAERSRKAYSRKLGSMGAVPPIFGPGVHRPTYERALQEYKANQKMWAGSNNASRGWGVGSGSGSSSTHAAGLGKLVAILFVFGFIMYLVSQGHDNKQTSVGDEPIPQAVPLSPAPADSYIAAKPSPIPETETTIPSNTTPAPSDIAAPPVGAALETENPANAYASSTLNQTSNEERPLVRETALSFSTPYLNPSQIRTFMDGSLLGTVSLWGSHKGSGGCSGLLTLTAVDLTFQCRKNAQDSFRFTRAEIVRADDDGIRVPSGRKEYHFKIDQVDKKDVKKFFAEWVRRTSDQQASNRTP